MAPGLERGLGGFQRPVEIVAGGVRQLGDDLAIGRIDDVLLVTAAAAEELAIDIQRKGFIGS